MNAASGGLHDDADGTQPLVFFQCGGLASGTAGDEEVDAGFDLPVDQRTQGGLVDGAV